MAVLERTAPVPGPYLRIGLIGAARIAPHGIIRPAGEVGRATIVAVAARNIVRAHAFAAKHCIGRVHESYAGLIADPDIDLVYIATPPVSHARIAIAAMEAGKHVLIEKPIAMNEAEAAAILDMASRRGVHAFEAMHAPHHALFGCIVSIIEGGELGRIRHIESRFSTMIERNSAEFRWRADLGGGALMDLAVYPLAFCRRLLGEAFRVRSVVADFQNGVDKAVRATLDYGAGRTAEIIASMVEPFDAFLAIECDHGSLRATNPVAPHLGNLLAIDSNRGSERREVGGPSSWTAQLQAVCATLLDGTPFPFAADDPIDSMAAIDAIRSHGEWQAGLTAAVSRSWPG